MPEIKKGVEITMIPTPPFGSGHWFSKRGYVRVAAMGDVRLRFDLHSGTSWVRTDYKNLTHDGGCDSVHVDGGTPTGCKVKVTRVDANGNLISPDHPSANVIVEYCLEIVDV